MPDSDDATLLDDQTRGLHRALIDAVLETGRVPELSALADQLDMSKEAIQEGLRDLAAADYLAVDIGDQPTCLYPLSTTPTSHVVVIDGQQRYAMCAIDALGIPAMLGEELDISAECAVCRALIALRVAPGRIMTASPAETMVVARRDEDGPAFAACCPFTLFVCGHEHADQFMGRIAGTNVLTLPEALEQAERIFGGLLDATLPARRRRGNRWESSAND